MMFRNLAVVLFLVASFNGSAQSSLFSSTLTNYANWKIEDKEAVWQYKFSSKIKDESALKGELIAFLDQDEYFQHVTLKNPVILGDVVKLKIDFKKYGGSKTYTSPAFVNGLWSGKLTINVVGGGYEVTASSITFENEKKGVNAGQGFNGNNEGKGSWSTISLNKDRKSFKEGRKLDIDLFNKALLDIFDLKK